MRYFSLAFGPQKYTKCQVDLSLKSQYSRPGFLLLSQVPEHVLSDNESSLY